MGRFGPPGSGVGAGASGGGGGGVGAGGAGGAGVGATGAAAVESGMNFAERMMAKMGHKEGQGGREGGGGREKRVMRGFGRTHRMGRERFRLCSSWMELQ